MTGNGGRVDLASCDGRTSAMPQVRRWVLAVALAAAAQADDRRGLELPPMTLKHLLQLNDPDITTLAPPPKRTTGTDLCPLVNFTSALRELARHLRSGTVDRAGGEIVLRRHFVDHFGRECVHRGAGRRGSPNWPPSARKAKKKLIADLGDGTTGTRFVSCVARRVGLKVDHNNKQRAGRTGTATFEDVDFVLDSPVPYLTDALLATHTRDQVTLMLTVRDPWDWAASRLKHHLPQSADWRAANGGCGDAFTKLSDAPRIVARDLLATWAWALCVAANRWDGGVASVPVINLFDDKSPRQLASRRALLAALRDAGYRVTVEALRAAWFQCDEQDKKPTSRTSTRRRFT